VSNLVNVVIVVGLLVGAPSAVVALIMQDRRKRGAE
jgi:hypothetical protein